MVDALAKGAAPKLKRLDLKAMGMTDEGAKGVAAALAMQDFPPSLSSLVVGGPDSYGNKLREEGRLALKQGLRDGGWLDKQHLLCLH